MNNPNNPKKSADPVEVVKKWLCTEKLYFTKIEGCCPSSISLSDVVFTYRWFTDQDEEYVGVDFWDLFGKGKEVLEHKLEELKGEKDDEPPDMKAALGTCDYIMDAFKSLSEEDIEVLIDNLCDCHKEIDTNVVIAREFIAPLLGPQGIIVLNSHHAASSELYAKEPSKLRVASPVSRIWRGLGIGHPCAWHGEVDMMVIPNNATSSGVTAVLAQHVTDDHQDEDMLDAGCTLVEGKQQLNDLGLGFSQAIATAITFSFVYKAHYSYQGTLFPTIQVSSSGFEIFLYDSETDVLLMSTFKWTPTTIVYLWAVLHYRLLLTKTTISSQDFKCGYRRLSDEFGGLTRLEGRTKFAVPIGSISQHRKHVNNVLLRSAGGKRKQRP